MSASNSNSAQLLKSFVERIERIEEERDEATAARKEVYTEAKDEGFDTKALRRLIKIRKMDPFTRKQEEEILGTYLDALGIE